MASEKITKAANRYVALADTKAAYLINQKGPNLSKTQTDYLQQRIKSYPKVMLDIGCGSGANLLSFAKSNPDTLCLGVEIRYKRAFRSAEKAELLDLDNVLVIRSSIHKVLEYLDGPIFDQICVYFPDPWDKRHWRKHRLINQTFLKKLIPLAKAHADFFYKTDHIQYFEETLQLLSEMSEFRIEEVRKDLHSETMPEQYTESEFEKFFKSKSIAINLLHAKIIRSDQKRAL